MARTKTLYTQAQLKALIAELEARAATPKGLSLDQMVQGSRAAIEKMLDAGCSLDDVSQAFHAVEIRASRRVLQYHRKSQSEKPPVTPRTKGKKSTIQPPLPAATPPTPPPESTPNGFLEMPPLDEL